MLVVIWLAYALFSPSFSLFLGVGGVEGEAS